VTTYTIQVIAGVLIIAGTMIGVFFRKAKRKAQELLHIDENAGKEIEADIEEIIPENTVKK
jgi:hypothetical protein